MTTLDLLYHHWPQTPREGNPREISNVGRDDLALLFADLGFRYGTEVGTEYGIYAETLLKTGMMLCCVDPYRAYDGYREHTSQLKLDDIYEQAKQRLAPYRNRCEIIRKPSVEAAATFLNESLDFCYIDSNHSLPHVIADLHAWVPKVRKGGIIAGHDFRRRNNRLRYQCHVVEAVYAYTQSYVIDPWFILGRKAVIEGEKRDAIRSFMWVKE